MKKAFQIAVLSFGFLGLFAGCAAVPSSGDAEDFSRVDLSSAREVTLTVHGLSCPLCASNLDGQLLRIAGVEGASLDLKTGAATVRLAEGHAVTAADLANAVANAGFTLKAIRVEKTVR